MFLDFEEVPLWCAGIKLSVTEENVDTFSWGEIIKELSWYRPSCVVVSVNEQETRVIEWCKENKFRKGPTIKNWLHDGRKTYLFFKQITKKDFMKYQDK
jgi:hypothetical protein